MQAGLELSIPGAAFHLHSVFRVRIHDPVCEALRSPLSRRLFSREVRPNTRQESLSARTTDLQPGRVLLAGAAPLICQQLGRDLESLSEPGYPHQDEGRTPGDMGVQMRRQLATSRR